MEIEGDNKNIGNETNNTGSSSHGALESSQNQPSRSVLTKVESHAPTKSSEDVAGGVINNPPVQMMERPGEPNTSPNYTFPSHVFSKSTANSQVEWSTASNESLFSIYMGNTSFSNELGCFKSWELDKSVDVSVQDQPYASPNHNLAASTNKFNAISKRTHVLQNELSSKNAEAKAAETMREVIMESSQTTQNVGKGDDKAFEPQRQSNDSSNSYAFQQSSKGPDKSVSSLSAGEKQEQQESSNTADQAPKPTTDASNGWSCFSCCS
ncbi:dentin sialophosphoprotein [Vigna radiata var. radiata]|uniref:Dentin sialophosphoprotein n=1 Tax=Vigna radiata var. radiata TaxID=3916 RepID=A0A1S3UKS8_VIGRR|nr:dentin sialophosphoprotein [Vigna radiata var. radiata]